MRSAGGYAASTETVTTVPPVEVDSSPFGQPIEVVTPGASMIATLVDAVDEVAPKSDRLWTAADTLKNVVVAAAHSGDKCEVIVTGLPGGRDISMKRVEAAFAPAEVEMVTPEDLKVYLELVPGYIGPQAVGP